nr:biotin/lipoyl-binding protein [Angustibacter aerolatus]
MKRRLRWINGVLAVVLVGAVAGAYAAFSDTPDTTTTSVRTATVTTGTVTATVSGTGNVASATTTDVTAGTSGTVESVKVKVGSKVKKGQTLAVLDDSDARSALTSARSALASARSQYDEVAAGQSATDREKDALAVEQAEPGRVERAVRLRRREGAARTQAKQQALSAKVQAAQAESTAETDAAKPSASEPGPGEGVARQRADRRRRRRVGRRRHGREGDARRHRHDGRRRDGRRGERVVRLRLVRVERHDRGVDDRRRRDHHVDLHVEPRRARCSRSPTSRRWRSAPTSPRPTSAT